MLARNIKELRIEKGYTQAQLAEQIGVTQGAVYFWEKGINEPTAGYLIKMARIFGTTVDELLSFESVEKREVFTKSSQMNTYFNRITDKQQELLIDLAKEFSKQNG
ncbi:MAG: helix-turn-helix transcriptional regulator [Clostridia bacterium]|nr:helix-turn-helix transcriptional regulator [Clostridia bacterium]